MEWLSKDLGESRFSLAIPTKEETLDELGSDFSPIAHHLMKLLVDLFPDRN